MTACDLVYDRANKGGHVALARFSEFALRSADLDEVLAKACQLAREVAGTDFARIVKWEEGTDESMVRAGSGSRPSLGGSGALTMADMNRGSYGLQADEPVNSPGLAVETRYDLPAHLLESGVRAVAIVRILGPAGNDFFGFLQVGSPNPNEFAEADMIVLCCCASIVAGTVHRLKELHKIATMAGRQDTSPEAWNLASWSMDLVSGVATWTYRHDQFFGCSAFCKWTYEAFLDHVVPADRGHVDDTFKDAKATGSDWRVACRIVRADSGEVRLIRVIGWFVGEAHLGGQTHLVIVVTDNTQSQADNASPAEQLPFGSTQEDCVGDHCHGLAIDGTRGQSDDARREQLDEGLLQLHKMEVVGQLTSGLAHDLNNFLTGIGSSVELIGTYATQGKTAKVGPHVETALSSVRRAATLIHRLLAFSRCQELEAKLIDVSGIAAGMEGLIRVVAGPQIQITMNLSPQPCQAVCNANQLESALLNLVVNARDAMPDGGSLVIGTTCDSLLIESGVLGAAHPGHAIHGTATAAHTALFIADSGTGMSPEVLARAFEPFYTTKRAGHGTGLGLAMVHAFVQQSSGCVRLRSVEGHGTTVALCLPRRGDNAEGEVV